MSGTLEQLLTDLVTEALPGLFAGEASPVKLNVSSNLFEVDPQSADSAANEPRPDDHVDNFPFDVQNPSESYSLRQSPYPTPCRIYLITDAGDRIPLQNDEVIWNKASPGVFSLQIRPNRELAGVKQIEVLYSVAAIFTKFKAVQTLTLKLQSKNAENLDKAEALVIAVIELNRERLVGKKLASYSEGEYEVNLDVKSLKLLKGTGSDGGDRLLTFQAEIELKATRTLRDDEGKPIKRIMTSGSSQVLG